MPGALLSKADATHKASAYFLLCAGDSEKFGKFLVQSFVSFCVVHNFVSTEIVKANTMTERIYQIIDAFEAKAKQVDELSQMSRPGYFTLEFDPDDHDVSDWQEIKIRISDHSHKPDNNFLSEHILSFVIGDRSTDETANKFDGEDFYLNNDQLSQDLLEIQSENNELCDLIGVDFKLDVVGVIDNI